MSAYYNELDPYCAAWLRNLISDGQIAPGEVDERSIVDVRPADLDGFGQCHWFAGIGGWSLALRLAGWPDDKPAFTGSCPCQPFSSAARGRNTGFSDDRDLWPAWAGLIRSRRPSIVFGEQVSTAVAWLDRACDQMEVMGYTCRATVLTSIGVGADHIRPRIYFAGHTDRDSQSALSVHAQAPRLPRPRGEPRRVGTSDGIPDRMAVLRAFGNAIDPRVAAKFIEAVTGAAA